MFSRTSTLKKLTVVIQYGSLFNSTRKLMQCLGMLWVSHQLGMSDVLAWLPTAIMVLNINMGSFHGPILYIQVILDNLQVSGNDNWRDRMH